MSQIENDILSDEDATLMLYVAGELDGEARQAIDRKLSRDLAFRDRVEAMARFDARMRGEASTRPVTSLESQRALTASLRLVREQALLLQSRPTRRAHVRFRGVPRWAWGTAVAACVVVGSVVWVTTLDPPAMKKPPYASQRDDDNLQRFFGLTNAFGSVEAAGTSVSPTDIQTQIDALDLLSGMNDPT